MIVGGAGDVGDASHVGRKKSEVWGRCPLDFFVPSTSQSKQRQGAYISINDLSM